MTPDPETERTLDPRIEATVSVERAAKVMGIARGSAYQAAKNGELPVIKVGRRLLVPTAALLELLGQKAS